MFIKGRVQGAWPPDRVVCMACGWRGKRKATVDSSGYQVRIDYGICPSGHEALVESKQWAADKKKFREEECAGRKTRRAMPR